MRRWFILASIALLTLPSARSVNAQGLLYTVTSTGDGGLVGSDSFCDDGTGQCTLRAAIEASDSHPGTDGINFDIPTSDPGFDPLTDSWTINLTKALPDISAAVGISGLGPDLLIVRRDTGGDYRIFNITASGVVTISGMTISNGNAPLNEVGGGIQTLFADTVNLSNVTVIGNSSAAGGGISNFGTATLNVTNSTITDNSVPDIGGGIFNETSGMINVTNSTVSNNHADRGGGISIALGTLNVTSSTFSGNSGSSGGGILNFSVTNITNSTFSHNSAENGGSIYDFGSDLNLTNSTITGNSASFEGGGIYENDGTTANVKSSIIALNTADSGPDVSGPGSVISGGFNLIGNADGSTGFDQPTDQTGTTLSPLDPKLDPDGFQENGGPTQTIALLFGSPAIDKGTSDGLTGTLSTDQRGAGFPRTFDNLAIPNAAGGDGTDIGAFEVQTAAPTQTPTPSPTPTATPTPTTLGNISTRLRVETGDNVLIGGFIITGTQSKKVIVRAIGPSLPLAGVLADPTLELHDGAGTLLVSNDNWMDAPNQQEIIDTMIPPANDLESAILTTLDPGLYTAIVRGVNDSTGIGLVEAYDLALTADSILANISTRGLVQTGDDVMIGGFIVAGEAAQQVLVRAIGPSLPVTGTLTDPTLDLFDGNGTLLSSNDNWRDTQEAEVTATMLPPTDDAESAILQTLAPAAYTAIVRGLNNTTGVALVEVYQLDN